MMDIQKNLLIYLIVLIIEIPNEYLKRLIDCVGSKTL